MKFFPFVFLVVVAFFWSSCDPLDLDRKEAFIRVQMAPPEELAIDAARLSAEIFEWQRVNPIDDHGFVWFTPENPQDQREPDLIFNQGILSLGAKTTAETATLFEAETNSLSPITSYVFRAYVSTENEVFYSAPQEYRSGTGSVTTLAANYQKGFEIELQGQLGGTEKGLLAVKHGFCWSAIQSQPTLADSSQNLGNLRNNAPFSYTLDGLVNDQMLFVRAFAIFRANSVFDTVYGQVIPFEGDLNFWTQRADAGGGPRENAVGFSIGNKGYIGTGDFGRRQDFWEYDPQTNQWTQRADIGGGGRHAAVGFSIGDKGYIGTGRGSDNEAKRDFWEYDPQTNIWSKKADFIGGARSYAIGFSIETKGYIGLGLDTTRFFSEPDFWEYDPQTNAWTRRADFAGTARWRAVGFSIGNKGYVGTGDATSGFAKDFWEYDPQADNWTQREDYGGGVKSNAVGFSIGNKGYIGTGGLFFSSTSTSDIWEYDPQVNAWTQRADLKGGARQGAVGFSIGNKGYIGTGDNVNAVRQNDFWEYDP